MSMHPLEQTFKCLVMQMLMSRDSLSVQMEEQAPIRVQGGLEWV